jgi:hypothetical protein
MKHLIIAIILVFGFLSADPQTKRALIIGIGSYPAESGWNTIHGDNDVPLIKGALLQRGFQKEKILTLVNEQATKNNIISHITQLIRQSQTNDIIYIHFSTHGQQVIDISGDEEDTLDEALIPYDARKKYEKGKYEGTHHLIDDELNEYCNSLRDKIGKNGTLVVVLDACHSGDATRGRKSRKDNTVFRGTSEIFQIGPRTKFNGQPSTPLEWIEISAAKSDQNNYEYKLNDSYYGSLSYAIKLALPVLINDDDYGGMFTKIQQKRQEINVTRYPQTPMIDGDSIYLKQKVF